MKKTTILTSITVCILSFASCGKQETTSGNESITATVESAQAETTVPEETETAATSLEDLVARLAGFSDIAEEVIKETQEKEGFLEGYND